MAISRFFFSPLSSLFFLPLIFPCREHRTVVAIFSGQLRLAPMATTLISSPNSLSLPLLISFFLSRNTLYLSTYGLWSNLYSGLPSTTRIDWGASEGVEKVGRSFA